MKEWDKYHMQMAVTAKTRANCLRRAVGAVLVRENRLIATGYNGTPHGVTNCLDSGCYRCENMDKFPPGQGYEQCLCVHAEENVLLQCARFGISALDSKLYSTLQPCFTCLKHAVQVGVTSVYYIHQWDDSTSVPAYVSLIHRLEEFKQLNV